MAGRTVDACQPDTSLGSAFCLRTDLMATASPLRG
jgi:hypothetical protein